jgi:hypothetical protein
MPEAIGGFGLLALHRETTPKVAADFVASALFHIFDHLIKEQFNPSHLIGLEGT